MATSRALNSKNDIFVRGSRLAMVSDGEQVIQHVRTRLQSYLEQWFLDLAVGTPYYEQVFIKPVNLNNIESILKTRIAQTPELKEITDFALEFSGPDTRILRVAFSAETDYGTVSNQEIFINE